LQSILEQVSILQGLDHPNIIRYLETYNDKTYLFVVTEFVEGHQVLEELSHGKGIPEENVRVYIKDLTTAVHHCHVKGIIHRAISPSSIIVTKGGHIKIVDFGFCTLAKNVD
jgi:serine/threonine protein kinase